MSQDYKWDIIQMHTKTKKKVQSVRQYINK